MRSVKYVSEFEEFSIFLPDKSGYYLEDYEDESCCAAIEVDPYKCDIRFRDRNRSSNRKDLIDNFASACKLEDPNWKPVHVKVTPEFVEIMFVDLRSYDPDETWYSTERITFTHNLKINVDVPRAQELPDYYHISFYEKCSILIDEERYGDIFLSWHINRCADGKYYAHYEVRE